ncbi:MAG TPA: tryptophan 2,3-dioxygenase family protein [Chitinophagaceae bacterium]|nr:tryptophan 2,3-dioxygenase [Chitinophagaceae bacterium]HQV05741.1 tryptophan 2,3-dioxygenase family protein [Chitinophagaceae bacterium]
MSAVNYHEYLQLEKILHAQSLESEKHQLPAHDEMLFIIIHQAYELWFKQLHEEVASVITIMDRPALNDNSPDLQTVVHRLNRCVTILRVLVHQLDIMETMTPMDFLDFRDMLRPASGFQSWQFKELEARLGLKFEDRHGKEYYTSQLKPEHVDIIKKAESSQSVLQLLNAWLERMPFLKEEAGPAFWKNYQSIYRESLAEAEKNNVDAFEEVFADKGHHASRALSPAACRAALFIKLYCGYPLLQLPYQLLNALLEIDEQLSAWRYRHMNMVHRMIGTRIGTGGSTGKDYLKAAADKHYIFKEIAQLNSFLVERRKLPALPKDVEAKLGFRVDD